MVEANPGGDGNNNGNPTEAPANNQQDAAQAEQAGAGGTGEQPSQLTDEQLAEEQKRINEQIEQDHANANYEAEIRQAINDSMPHISELMDLSTLKEEYKANKFELCFDVLYARYRNVRRMRRDGSCFYRSFLF